MAGISVGATAGPRKALDSEVSMVPMIDLLICCITFLLLTAVWSTYSKLDASATTPGAQQKKCGSCSIETSKALHVYAVNDDKFSLVWQKDSVALSSVDVPRRAFDSNAKEKYPELAAQIAQMWSSSGEHRDASDTVPDRAVIHVNNDLRYDEIVGIMDAAHAPKRELQNQKVPAFQVELAN